MSFHDILPCAKSPKREETENYVIKVRTSGKARRCYLIKAIFILCLASLLAVLILMIFLTPVLSALGPPRGGEVEAP